MPVAVALLPLVAGLSTGVLAVRKKIQKEEAPAKEKAKEFVNAPLKPAKPFLFIVNGTGHSGNAEYQKQNEESFLWKLHNKLPSQSEYLRGPDNGGFAVDDLVNALEQRLISYELPAELHFAGWSRGGRIVIEVARRLQQKHNGVPIKAMYLLDAVDRVFHDGDYSSATIPENVGVCYHAIRDPNYSRSLKDKYQNEARRLNKEAHELFIKERFPSPKQPKVSHDEVRSKFRELDKVRDYASSAMPAARDSFGIAKGVGASIDFGNTGTKLENPIGQCEDNTGEIYATTCLVGNFKNKLIINYFQTSHAGMGGVPWKLDYLEGEVAGSEKACKWIEDCMRKEGIFST